MSISSLSSSATQYISNWQAIRQRQQDFQTLGSSLQSGDLAGAQQAYSDLQSFASQSSQGTTSATTSSGAAVNPVQQDFAAIGQDLSSGNLAQAQKDYAQLKTDFQSAFQQNGGLAVHQHHHHHTASQTQSGTAANPSTTPPTATTALNSAGAAALSQYSNSPTGSLASSLLSLVL